MNAWIIAFNDEQGKFKNELMNEWMKGWIKGRMIEWMNELTAVLFCQFYWVNVLNKIIILGFNSFSISSIFFNIFLDEFDS